MAFRTLYRAYVRPVYWIAHGLVGNAADAEDVTQETFLAAWRKLHGFELAGESLLPWLATICRFQAANRIRRQRRDREHTAGAADESLPATVDVEQQVIDARPGRAHPARSLGAERARPRDLPALRRRGLRLPGGRRPARRRARRRPQSSLPDPHAPADDCQGEHMNTSPGATPVADEPREDASGLPPLDDDTIARIESRVFAGIAHDRTAARARRGRWWIGGAAAAVIVVVAAAIAPMVVPLVSGSSGSLSDEAGSAPIVAPESAGERLRRRGRRARHVRAGCGIRPPRRDARRAATSSRPHRRPWWSTT